MTWDAHKELVAGFLHALVQEDSQAMRPLVRDEVIWWVPPSASQRFGLERPLQGWDDIAWLGGPGWKGFLPGTSVLTIHHLVADGDLVSAHYNRSAKRLDGTDYDTEYNILFRLSSGRIAEVWEIADTARAFDT